MKKYQHIYFDLDRTLWDFDSNSVEVLAELYHKHKLEDYFSDDRDFIATYHRHNEKLWAQYRDGNLTKEILRSKRFALCLEERSIEDAGLAERIGDEYLDQCSLKTRLFPNSHELLSYLKEKYHLYILTNGFRETQHKKLQNCGLDHFFERVFTSETLGYNKPDPRIFRWALSSVNAKKEQALMIGDDPDVDIAGAKNAGIDTVFFNPGKMKHPVKADFEITNLIELKNIL